MSRTDKKPVVLGRVSGLFGVKGWVRIHSFTEPRAAILDYTDWYLEQGGNWRPARFAEGRLHGKTIVARFEGIDDRDVAAGIIDALIGVNRDRLPETEIGEYYWSDLEGLTVVRKDGNVLGMVAYLLETGANDVLVVREGEREVLIPFLKDDVILDVDLAQGEISVDWDWE